MSVQGHEARGARREVREAGVGLASRLWLLASRLVPSQPTPLWLVVVFASAPLGVFEFVLPLFGTTLGASATTVGWLFSIFSVTALTLRPLVGYLLDLGRQEVRPPWVPAPTALLAVGLAAYAVAMALFAVAESVAMLVAARLVQGIASTITWLTVTVLLADESNPDERAQAFGLLTSLGVIGSGLGASWTVAVIGLFDATTREQVTSFLPEITRLTGITLGWLVFPTPALSTVAALHIVFWGYVGFVALALGALWGGMQNATCKMQNTPLVTHPSSLTPRHSPLVTRYLPIIPLLIGAFLRAGGYALTLPVLTVYLNERFGAGLVGVGLAFVLPGVVYAIAPGPLGRLADRVGHLRAAVAGLLASVITYVLLPLLPSLWLLVPLWTFEALCFCLAGPSLSALLTERVAEQVRGRAFALYALAGGLGAAITPAIGGWMYDEWGAAWPFWGHGLLIGLSALAVAWPVEARDD